MIPGIVLAAGKSTRMGRPKALLPIGAGETFLSRIVATFRAADVTDVVIVVGSDASAVMSDAERRDVQARFAYNPDFERGQLSSLLTGLRVIDRPGVAAALVTLVDVPLVAPSTVRAVIERYRLVHAPIVRPVRGPSHGHPVLIDRSLFDLLRTGDQSEGAKPIVHRYASPAGDVSVDDEGAFVDIDTPADYQSVRGPDAAE